MFGCKKMSHISEPEIAVLLEKLKKLGILINKDAIELVIAIKNTYKIVLRTTIVYIELNDGDIQAYEVTTREEKLLASYYA
jgi:hypothetical protein